MKEKTCQCKSAKFLAGTLIVTSASSLEFINMVTFTFNIQLLNNKILGMENFDAIKKDPKLCFIEKEIEEMPTTIELNTRFKRIILMLSRKLEMALAAATNASNTSRLKRYSLFLLL